MIISNSSCRSIGSRSTSKTEVFKEVSIVSVISAIFIKRAFIIPNFTSSVGHKTDSFRFNIPPIAEIIVAKGFFSSCSKWAIPMVCTRTLLSVIFIEFHCQTKQITKPIRKSNSIHNTPLRARKTKGSLKEAVIWCL